MTVDAWWKHAVFYQLDPLTFQDSNGDGFGDLNGIAGRLDYLQSLGVDAIVLSPFQLPPTAEGAAAAKKTALDAAYGTDEDFDKLEHEASLRKIRLVVDLPLSGKRSAQETLSVARFWLSRGVGGLRLTAEPDDPAMGSLGPAEREERVRQLRHLCASYLGERVTIWDVPGVAAPGEERSRNDGGPQLTIDHTMANFSSFDQAGLRSFLVGAKVGDAMAVSDTTEGSRSLGRLGGNAQGVRDAAGLAKTVAAALFLGRETPMLFFGQELGMASAGSAPAPMQWGGDKGFSSGTPWVEMGPNAATANVAEEDANADSLLNWYRTLSGLLHTNGALQGGTVTMVETGYPDVVAWVRKGATGREQPVLAVCNLSARPVLISLTEALNRVSVRANSGIEPIAMSFKGSASFTANGISLPPYGVYVGELIQPGLEDSPAPAMSHKRGR
jgi:alpha-glucosidase